MFGDRLKAERKRRELTVAKLAERCGSSRSYMTLIENNMRSPSRKMLPKIAKALDVKTSTVINWYLESLRIAIEKELNI